MGCRYTGGMPYRNHYLYRHEDVLETFGVEEPGMGRLYVLFRDLDACQMSLAKAS
jgi:hypothetical protein